MPRAVDRYRVTQTQLIGALKGSSDGMTSLLTLGLKRDGRIRRRRHMYRAIRRSTWGTCWPISLPTKLIIEARSCSWRASSVIGSHRLCRMVSGRGPGEPRRCGSSSTTWGRVALRLAGPRMPSVRDGGEKDPGDTTSAWG